MNGLVKSITCSLKQGWMHNKQQVGNDNAIIGSMRREQGFFVRKSATRTEKIGKLDTFEQWVSNFEYFRSFYFGNLLFASNGRGGEGCLEVESLHSIVNWITHSILPGIIDCHWSHCNICFSVNKFSNYPIPLICLVIKHSIQPVRNSVDAKLKLGNLGTINYHVLHWSFNKLFFLSLVLQKRKKTYFANRIKQIDCKSLVSFIARAVFTF